MMEGLAQKILAILERVTRAKTSGQLDAIEHELFGRKRGFLTLAMKELQTMEPEKKKLHARRLNELKQKSLENIALRRSELSSDSKDGLTDDVIDVTLDLPERERGHLHLIPEFIEKVEEVFGRMGFDVEYGPEIETEETNFDLLNFPKDHPARDVQDIFYVKPNQPNTHNKPLLRAHTSPVQIHYMRAHKPPFRMICPGKVYRRDADATHSPMFHQFEGLMIGKDVNLANMKAVMIAAVQELVSPDIDFRFRAGYFPFVEPGLEMDIRWTGKSKTKEGDWLEICGCGMVHPNVLKNVGIDTKKWQGFAFGFGVERLIMIKHRIPDIRLFFEGDLRFLTQF